MVIQVQMSPGCVHGQQTVVLVRGVLSQLAPDARLEISVYARWRMRNASVSGE